MHNLNQHWSYIWPYTGHWSIFFSKEFILNAFVLCVYLVLLKCIPNISSFFYLLREYSPGQCCASPITSALQKHFLIYMLRLS